jgi:hypothetical protein
MIIETAILGAIITAIGLLYKQIGIPNRIIPLVVVVTGIIVSVFFWKVSTEMGTAILIGLIAGLAASGLYDNVAVGVFDKTLNEKK